MSWWPGDGSGDDIIGINNGFPRNGATFDTGFVTSGTGQAFDLDGGDDYFELFPVMSSLNFAQPATLDAWVRSSHDDNQVILAISDGSDTNRLNLTIGDNATTALEDELITVSHTIGGTANYVLAYTTSTRTELFDGGFHHVAVTFDGEVTIYLDGLQKPVSVGVGANGGQYGGIPGATRSYVGAEDIGGPRTFFSGEIDELELYDRALSGSEVLGIFNAASFGKCRPVDVSSSVEDAKLTSSDLSASDRFSRAISISGETVVVGALDSAYVFDRPVSGWSDKNEDSKLIPGGAGVVDFGRSVSVSGDTAVIGASGSTHVFVRSGGTWTERATLTPSDAGALFFPRSLSISGDTVVAGAAESAYVFVRPASGWTDNTEDAKLTPGAGTDAFFSRSVSISGDTVVVGADERAYVFVRPAGGWISKAEDANLTPSGAPGFSSFGESVSISGDTVLIGAPFDPFSGSAYVFVRPASGWTDNTEDAKLTGGRFGGFFCCSFGRSVAISGDNAIAGSNSTAHLFVRTGTAWSERERLIPGGAAPFELLGFGLAVSISGDNSAVGAPLPAHHEPGFGSAYVYEGLESDGDGDGVPDSFEAGFAGSSPEDSIGIINPETGDAGSSSGSASTGSEITSGSFVVEFPAGASVASGSAKIELEFVPGSTSTVVISGADLGGGTKTVTMPFDATAPAAFVCIQDAPDATLETIVGSGGCAGVLIAIPDQTGASTSLDTDGIPTPYSVTRLSTAPPRVRIQGLLNTAMATLTDLTDFDVDGVPDSDDECPALSAIVSGVDRDGNDNGCPDTTDELIDEIQFAALRTGVTKALISKVDDAEKSYDKGKNKAGNSKLGDFIDQVNAQRGKKIPAEIADRFLVIAENIVALHP